MIKLDANLLFCALQSEKTACINALNECVKMGRFNEAKKHLSNIEQLSPAIAAIRPLADAYYELVYYVKAAPSAPPMPPVAPKASVGVAQDIRNAPGQLEQIADAIKAQQKRPGSPQPVSVPVKPSAGPAPDFGKIECTKLEVPLAPLGDGDKEE